MQSVRQALNYALDRERIADTIWHGLSKPEALPWSATSPAYDAAKSAVFDFDLGKARSLLARSGSSNITVEYQWSTSGGSDAASVAQIYRADLAKIGVTLTLKPAEAAVHVSMLSAKSFRGLATSAGTYGQGATYGPDVQGLRYDAHEALVLSEVWLA